MLEELKVVRLVGIGVSTGSGDWGDVQGPDHPRCWRPWGTGWGLLEVLPSGDKSRAPGPRLLAVSSVPLLRHAVPKKCGLLAIVGCQSGGKPHLHSVSIPVSSLTYLGLSNLCSCCTWAVNVGLRGLPVFVSVKEKYYCLHWSHLF